jgi:hypothetical protein
MNDTGQSLWNHFVNFVYDHIQGILTQGTIVSFLEFFNRLDKGKFTSIFLNVSSVMDWIWQIDVTITFFLLIIWASEKINRKINKKRNRP